LTRLHIADCIGFEPTILWLTATCLSL